MDKLPTLLTHAIEQAAKEQAVDIRAQLTTGLIVRFTTARPIDEHFVHIDGISEINNKPVSETSFPNGMDVRPKAIAWMADCMVAF